MKVLMALAIFGVTLLAGPVIDPGQLLHAQSTRQPKDQPKPQPSTGGRTAPPPRQDPPPPRAEPPAAPQPKPPQSTGEPELKRRKP